MTEAEKRREATIAYAESVANSIPADTDGGLIEDPDVVEVIITELRSRLDKAEASAIAAWQERDEMRKLIMESDKVVVAAAALIAYLAARVK